MPEIHVYTDEVIRRYPHYWETCVGSCHAATVLREDVRQHIRQAHEDCGFRYLRFHGLFDDDMSVVMSQRSFFGDKPTISFYNIDSIFDFLLSIGMKPFVELGFMPEAYASGSRTCMHYKANVTMPKEMAQWENLIRCFAEHLIERYGEEEVANWFFEVWNEPNLSYFFAGSMTDYFHLYETTARTLKAVSPQLRVGGPATSGNEWIPEFIDFCKAGDVPVDFITTHHYPDHDPLSTVGKNGLTEQGKTYEETFMEARKDPAKMKEMMAHFQARENTNPRDVMEQMTRKAKKEAGELPLYYTEWNGSKEYDSSYQAAFILHTLSHNHDLVEGYSYWTVSDLFEEMGLFPAPFKNTMGLLNNQGIKKPSYHAFEQLHRAGDRQLRTVGATRTAEAFALADGNGATVFVFNHDIDRRDIQNEVVSLCVHGAFRTASVAWINQAHCNPQAAWEQMGSPTYLKEDEVEQLRAASTLSFEELIAPNDDEWRIELTMEPESVAILRFEK